MIHRSTIAVYEREADRYAERRGVRSPERVRTFGAELAAGRRLDLGCGPGHHLPLLGGPVFALDAAEAMLHTTRRAHPDVPVVRADLADLPFGRATFEGVWASKAHQHLPAADLPMALADVHRVLATGGRLELTMFAGPGSEQEPRQEVSSESSGDDLPGRFFTWWPPARLAEVVAAAGFRVERLAVAEPDSGGHAVIELGARAERALPDHVGAGMRLLCCGLNPSLHAADAGVGYVTGSNRFWRALTAAGLASRTRDSRHLLRHDRIGMTDLVQRPTPRAEELTRDEYRVGVERLERLCAWLRPAAVAMVGLSGWRAAVDRRATVGWQPPALGGTPVYVLPSTSGLNSRVPLSELAAHLAAAADGPGAPPAG